MNTTKPVTLSELQLHLDQLCRQKGWDKNTDPEAFLLLTEEVGELAKAIRNQTGFKGEARPDNTDNLRQEFADVLNYLMDLANRFDIDLTEAYFEKYEINSKRVWE